MSSTVDKAIISVDEKKGSNSVEEAVPLNIRNSNLESSIFHIVRESPFIGTILQCMDINYSNQIETAGICFDVQSKKWVMMLNDQFFCRKLNDFTRAGVLLHEIWHVTHKHPIRIPFARVSAHKRHIWNIAADMVINQYIKHLPKGCPKCPPLEQREQGAKCENDLCPGHAIYVENFSDKDPKTGVKIPWQKEKTMEYYYEKLLTQYPETDQNDHNLVHVSAVFTDDVPTVAAGTKASKTLTALQDGSITNLNSKCLHNAAILLTAQVDPRDNGVYDVIDVGNPTTPFVLKRHKAHNGSISNPIKVDDIVMEKHLKVSKKGTVQGWVVTGTARAADSRLVLVDQDALNFMEQEINMSFQGGDGKGMPSPHDAHPWDAAAEESEMLDATEELVKRAMQKRDLSYDTLPQHFKELLKEIEGRKAELNYRKIILSAVKKHASGYNREFTWTRPSRRFGNKSPGSRIGRLPSIVNMIDTSGSISIEEANEFLSIVDEFLRVGSRTCKIGLWHTDLYYFDKYKLGTQFKREEFQSGGTDPEPALKKVFDDKPDLTIILTDGCYSNVEYEKWLRNTDKPPQILWIISKDGQEDHPLKRLGNTIKIPKS